MRVFNNQRYLAIFFIVVGLIQVYRSENIRYNKRIYQLCIVAIMLIKYMDLECTYCATYAHAKIFIDE